MAARRLLITEFLIGKENPVIQEFQVLIDQATESIRAEPGRYELDLYDLGYEHGKVAGICLFKGNESDQNLSASVVLVPDFGMIARFHSFRKNQGAVRMDTHFHLLTASGVVQWFSGEEVIRSGVEAALRAAALSD